MKKVLFAFASMVCVYACSSDGGSSGPGVPDNTRLSALTDAQARSLCNYLADQAGAYRMGTCSDGTMWEAGIKAEERAAEIDDCVADFKDQGMQLPDCELTVGQYTDCVDDISAFSDDQAFCQDTPLPASCEPLFNPSPACGGQ